MLSVVTLAYPLDSNFRGQEGGDDSASTLFNTLLVRLRQKKMLIFGTWNLCTLMDRKNMSRPQRRTAIIARELIAQYNIDKKNGLLLLTPCAENDLTITNTLFRMANKYKTSWKHPTSNQWHPIDYVFACRRDVHDVWINRAMQEVEC